MSSPDPIADLDDDEREALEPLVPEGDTLEAVLDDVQAAVNRIANLDVDVDEPADLDRVRTALPTEPHRAELVEAALPRALRGAITYVHPSERQSGYWRRTPGLEDPENLSDAQLKVRLAFVEAGIAERDTRGVTRTADGRVISEAAANIGDRIEGMEVESGPDEEKGQGILARIMDRL